MKKIVNIEELHEDFETFPKEVKNNNNEEPVRAQWKHNEKKNLQLVNISIDDYVMLRTHAKR